jgi:hypothetical protein
MTAAAEAHHQLNRSNGAPCGQLKEIGMRSLLLAIFAMLSITPCFAQKPNYLNDPAMFAKGWSQIIDKMGPAVDVADIAIRPDAIEVLARSTEGGARIDRWRGSYRTVLSVTFHAVSGPNPERPSSPVANVEGGFFKLATVPVDKLWAVLDLAKTRARLEDTGEISSVRIARLVTLLPNPAYGEVRWTINIASARETATATAAADGHIMGIDISGTNRGRNRNFLEQDEWPLADAQASFRSIVDARPIVYEIDVSRNSVKMTAVAQASPTAVTAWLWDGGTFRRDFIDGPNFELIRSGGNLPFTLGEVDLAKLPAILKAARDKEPSGHPRIVIAKAIKERVAVGSPRVLWEIQMVDSRRQIPLFGEDFSERTIVKVSTSSEVISVLLPRSLRPKVDPFGTQTVLAAIAKFKEAYGGDSKIVELRFSGTRVRLNMLLPGTPGRTFEVELTEKGLQETSSSAMAMTNLRSFFILDDLSRLTMATIDDMLAKAQAQVPLPGSTVHGIRFWSGEPFWRPRQGLPYVDIRVGVPPRHDVGGYVVFSADGKWIETVK